MRLTEVELTRIAERVPEKDFRAMEPWLTRLYKAIQDAEDANGGTPSYRRAELLELIRITPTVPPRWFEVANPIRAIVWITGPHRRARRLKAIRVALGWRAQ